VFYNGLHLEAAMGEVLEELDRWKPTRAVSDSIDRRHLRSPPEFKGNYDPHVWFDVGLWERTVPVIVAALSSLDTVHAGEFAARGSAYAAELRALDAWVRMRVAQLPPERRVLVTAHDAFNYFGRAYGFEVKGLQGISTAAEAGTGDVQQLASFVASRRIPAIFVESSISPRSVQAVQAAVRARGFNVSLGGSLFSDAMGDAGTPEGTYIGMVRHNVNTIVDALSAGEVAAVASGGGGRDE
jgi:manganese/zinc/iron transport system substrate-binding protein